MEAALILTPLQAPLISEHCQRTADEHSTCVIVFYYSIDESRPGTYRQISPPFLTRHRRRAKRAGNAVTMLRSVGFTVIVVAFCCAGDLP